MKETSPLLFGRGPVKRYWEIIADTLSKPDGVRLGVSRESCWKNSLDSLFGMLLLTMKPPPESIWRWCSGFAAICEIPFAITIIKRMRALSPADFKHVSKIIFYPGLALANAALLLQFYNLAVLNSFWPFFAEIFIHLIGAMGQFVRLVLLLPGEGF